MISIRTALLASAATVLSLAATPAALARGLSISRDGGSSWTNITAANGLGSNNVLDVYASASGSTIDAATEGGLSISGDGDSSWVP